MPAPWVWSGQERGISLDVGELNVGTTGQGLVIPTERLAVVPGQALRLVGRSTRGPVTWSVADAELAMVSPDLFGIPMASAPGGFGRPGEVPGPPGSPYGATVKAIAPGAVLVTASAGGEQSRALMACVADPAPALSFHFVEGRGEPSPAIASGAQVILDEATWQAYWRAAFGTSVGAAPSVDFAVYSVVTFLDNRVTYGERGEPVIARIAQGGRLVQLVMPGVESLTATPRQAWKLSLFLTGKLPADARVRTSTLCSEVSAKIRILP